VTADTFVTNINDHTLYARWTANGDTPYTVYHWLIALDGSRSPGARVDLTGQTDTIAYAPPRTFTGYTLNTSYPGTVASGNIAANGSLQLHLYYVAIPPPPPPPPPPPAPTNPPITQVEQPAPTTVPPTPTPTTPAPTPTPPAPTPPPPTDIADPAPPQTITPAPAKQGAWALLNLILSILGALLAAIALLRFALARRQEEDVEQDGSTTTSYRPHARWWILTLAATVLAVVIFLITEDMRLPITLADWWTIVHAIILIIQLAFFVLAMRRTGDEDDGQQRQGDQANYA
jgi:hypothetical protein